MIAVIALWSHALAAAGFGILALWQLSRPERRKAMIVLGVAFAATAIWAALVALRGADDMFARGAETARNLAYLGYLLALLRYGVTGERQRFVRLVFYALFVVGLFVALSDFAFAIRLSDDVRLALVYQSTTVLHVLFMIGALLLVHLLYTSAAPEARWGIRLSMTALAALWAYDLNLYTFAWLSGAPQRELLSLRGILALALVPYFASAIRRSPEWKMKVSRTVTFRSLSLVAILGYFGAMYLALAATEMLAGERAAALQVALVFLMSVGAILLLPSERVRGWIKVKLAKHFFEHRYDYRSEWIRFNETLARPDEEADPLDVRAVRAIAEIAGSKGGLLLGCHTGGGFAPGARWKWRDCEVPHRAAGTALVRWLEASGQIVEIDPLRDANGDAPPIASLVPDWMRDLPAAWAIVPLIHGDRLVAAVLLERPQFGRTLDWEDFDLLKIAGRQAASYLAEAESRDALAEARRFDEFNRRFAFILHDVKNIASGLTLVARNAERHADNPEFRTDMIATLKDSVGTLNTLLERLAPNRRGRSEPPRATGLRSVAEAVAAQKTGAHPVRLAPGEEIAVLADRNRLETALVHLVQNAIDASAPDSPVVIAVDRGKNEGCIAVRDRGAGMSGDFIRNHLFRPFSSSKETGFGIGAYEARALIAEMGGRLEVESREGEGSCFSIILPLVDQLAEPAATEKMSA